MSQCVGKMPPALPLLQQDLGLDLRQIGWVVSLFSTMSMLCAVVMGLLAGRFGAWRFTLLGLGFLSGGGLLGAAASSYEMLLASRLIEGVGQIAIAVAVPALVVGRAAPHQQRLVMGLWSSYMPLGVSSALVLAPLFLGGGHWRALWTAIALATAFCGVWVWLWRDRYDVSPIQQSADWRQLTGGLRQWAPWLLALSFSFYAVQFFIVMTFLPTWVIQERGWSVHDASLLTASVVIFNAFGTLLGTVLVQRGLRPSQLIIFTQAAVGVCALAIFVESLPDAVRLMACMGMNLFGGILPAATMSSAPRLASSPNQIGSLQGLFLQGSNLGQFTAAPLVTLVVTAGGGAPNWGNAMPIVAGSALAGLAMGIGARLRGL